MKTWSFIGSDKNAGKTTVLNFIHSRLRDQAGAPAICITSIGINGEEIDNYENLPKPRIPLFPGDLFVTAEIHLAGYSGDFELLNGFGRPDFKKNYLFGRTLTKFTPVIEGPNEKIEILRLKRGLAPLIRNGYLLIDGSIDRQFLGHPRISDEICFALLISSRKEQQKKASDILFALSIPESSKEEKALISKRAGRKTRSLLLSNDGKLLYRGKEFPFMDESLKESCLKNREKDCLLYLNGALTRSLHTFLAPFQEFRIILDNFTLYQNVSATDSPGTVFKPELSLLRPVLVRQIFIKRESDINLRLPEGIPVYNLFEEQ